MAIPTINATANYKIAYDQVTNLSKCKCTYYSIKGILDSLDLQLNNKTFIPTNEFLAHFVKNNNNVNIYCMYDDVIRLSFKMIESYHLDIIPELISFVFKHYDWENQIDMLCNKYINYKKKIPISEMIELSLQAKMVNCNRCIEDPKIVKSRLCLLLDKVKYIKNITFDEKTIDCIFEHNLKNMMSYLIKKNTQIKNKYIDYAIINNNKEMFDLLFTRIQSLTVEHLYLACKHADINIIKDILDQKIQPDEKCIERMFEKNIVVAQEYAQLATPISSLSELENMKHKVEILIIYGYNITKKDLLIITKGGVPLEDKYVQKDFFDDIVFKNEMTNECNKNLLYIYGIDRNKFGLIEHFRRKSSMASIKEYITKSKIQPDIECLKEACKHKNNIQIIKLLTDKYGIDPDFECLINCVMIINGNIQLKHIATKARKAFLQEDSDDENTDLDKLEADNDNTDSDNLEADESDEEVDVKAKKKPNPKPKKSGKSKLIYDSSDEVVGILSIKPISDSLDESEEKPVLKAKKKTVRLQKK
jgi:hypothetical protein